MFGSFVEEAAATKKERKKNMDSGVGSQEVFYGKLSPPLSPGPPRATL